MGIARTSVAVTNGLDAVGINPANLALPGNDVITMTIFPFGGSVGSDFITYDSYSRYFKNRNELLQLPDEDKRYILESFNNPTGTASVEAIVRLFGIALRIDPTKKIAFTVDYELLGAASIPKEYARLLLYGNLPGSTFNIDGINVQAYWARTYTLSFGQILPAPNFLSWLSAGIAAKMIQGYGYFEIDKFTSSLRSNSAGILSGRLAWHARWTATNSISGDLFQSPTGYGMGFDVGIAGGLNHYVSFGISVTDIGWINWSKDVMESSPDSSVTSANPNLLKDIRFTNPANDARTKSGEPFSSSLPTVLRVGISAQIDRMRNDFPGELLLAAEFAHGLGSAAPLRDQPRLSFGAEYRPVHWLPLRTGLSLSGGSPAHVSFGFGFNFRQFDFDVATESVDWIMTKRFSAGSIGVGMQLRILN